MNLTSEGNFQTNKLGKTCIGPCDISALAEESSSLTCVRILRQCRVHALWNELLFRLRHKVRVQGSY
jgi:hypothetical protein